MLAWAFSFSSHTWYYHHDITEILLLWHKTTTKKQTVWQIRFVCLLFYTVATSKVISGWVASWMRTHGDWQIGCLHHAPLSHSVTLSWLWANQPLPYPLNGNHHARTWQEYTWEVIGLIRTPDLPHTRPTLYRFVYSSRYAILSLQNMDISGKNNGDSYI